MIEFRNVSKAFATNKAAVIKNINIQINSHETLVILGPSGSGKTTILNLINGLIKPDTGDILIDNKLSSDYDPIQLRRRMGYVFQGVGLFPQLTVAENIGIILKLNRVPAAIRSKRVNQLLELVNLPLSYVTRLPDELSGGEAQRVAVARALAVDPDYLLMDEPFAALDAINRDNLQQELLKLKKKLNKTIVLVTHDFHEAILLGDRIAVMHQGVLEQIGDKHAIINHPQTPFIKSLIENAVRQWQHYLDELNDG